MLVFSRKRVQQVCTTLRTLDSNGRALHFSLESALFFAVPWLTPG